MIEVLEKPKKEYATLAVAIFAELMPSSSFSQVLEEVNKITSEDRKNYIEDFKKEGILIKKVEA